MADKKEEAVVMDLIYDALKLLPSQDRFLVLKATCILLGIDIGKDNKQPS